MKKFFKALSACVATKHEIRNARLTNEQGLVTNLWTGGARPPTDGLKYFTGSTTYIPTANLNHYINLAHSAAAGGIVASAPEDFFLTKKALGPVVTMMNLSMKRSCPNPFRSRSKAFLKGLLELNATLRFSMQHQSVVHELFRPDCGVKMENKQIEALRKKYQQKIAKYKPYDPANPKYPHQRDFDAGNPHFSRYTGGTWEDAVDLGNLQVKCGILKLLNEKKYDKTEAIQYIKNLPEPLQHVLEAKLGYVGKLFRMVKLEGWYLKYSEPSRKVKEDGKVHDPLEAAVLSVAKEVEEIAKEADDQQKESALALPAP